MPGCIADEPRDCEWRPHAGYGLSPESAARHRQLLQHHADQGENEQIGMAARIRRARGPESKLRALSPGLEPLDNDRPVTCAPGCGQKRLVAGNMRLGLGLSSLNTSSQAPNPCLDVECFALQAESQRAQAIHFTRQSEP